jgi:hypothetical protein
MELTEKKAKRRGKQRASKCGIKKDQQAKEMLKGLPSITKPI